MDSFEINKIIAAILLVALLVIGLGKISNVIFHVESPKTQGYSVKVGQVTSLSDEKQNNKDQETSVDISAIMALGNVEKGEKIFKKCAACHSIVKDGGNKIGPALYNVVGREVGSLSDYKYSKALLKYTKDWTFEELNGYLKKPTTYLKGTKMAFAGLRKEEDRASVIKYLNKNSDNPKQLP